MINPAPALYVRSSKELVSPIMVDREGRSWPATD
jgi:hypothetical protein